jgi:thiol-disulfide isomerase/thioredoxin
VNANLRLAIIVALCLTAGFFTGRMFWPSVPESPRAAADVAAGPAAGGATRVPEFQLKDLAGATRSISEWTGQATIINFWATWCAPCREEMPLLEQLHQERKDRGLAVIGVAIDREEPVRIFVGETGVSYPILVGQMDATAAAESFGPDFVGLPLTAFAAPGGDILDLHVGQVHATDLARFLDVLDRLAAGTLDLAGARQALAAAKAQASR